MPSRLVWLAALTVCALVLWLLSREQDSDPDLPRVDPVQTTGAAPESSADSSEREPVPGPAGEDVTGEPADSEAAGAHGPAWSEVLVVDDFAKPVAACRLVAWRGAKFDRSVRAPGVDAVTRDGWTAADGVWRFEYEDGLRIWAEKDGVGRSGTVRVGRPGARQVVTLHRPIMVRGVVVEGVDTPVSGAAVDVSRSGGRFGGPRMVPDRVSTDRDGRFELDVGPGGLYSIRAEKGEVSTFPVRFDTISDESDHEIVLRFPGGFTLRGVVASEGADRGLGVVRAWSTMDDGTGFRVDNWKGTVKVGKDGAFELTLPKPGEYAAVWNPDRRLPSMVREFAVTTDRPVENVTLRSAPASEIAGTITRPDGMPVPGVHVYLRPDVDSVHPMDMDVRKLFGVVDAVTSSETGSFRFEDVHPGTPWRLTVCPRNDATELRVERSGLRAGDTNVSVLLSALELSGCYVTGRVVTAAGEPEEDFDLRWTRVLDAGGTRTSSGSVPDLSIEKERFRFGPVAPGTRCFVVADARPESGEIWSAASSLLTVDQDEVDVLLRVPELGRVSVLVKDAEGRPAPAVPVFGVPEPRPPWYRRFRRPQTSGEDGRMEWTLLHPTRWRFGVRRGADVVTERFVDVREGGLVSVELVLPPG